MMTLRFASAALLLAALPPSALLAAEAPADYSVIVRGGTIFDGSGGQPIVGDVAIKGDRIVYVGPKAPGSAAKVVDASGKAVSPGFINMLSWAVESLIEDGRGVGDLVQGVTLEVFGEGNSMGPLNATMKKNDRERQGDIKYPIQWTTLGQYLEYLEKRGVSPNVASFIGATSVRIHELGEKDVDPTPEQLERMKALVRAAMKEGAMGVGSSMIYAPANYAETPELIAITSEAGKCGGMYISTCIGADRLTEAIDR